MFVHEIELTKTHLLNVIYLPLFNPIFDKNLNEVLFENFNEVPLATIIYWLNNIS